jgi:hypothetical protein
VIIIGGVILIVVGSAVLLMMSKFHPTVPLYLGSGVFDTKIAYTQAEREKGYSGVASIADNQALILAFPHDDIWSIWMKDMKVPIDIVWLNQDKKVVYIVKNASPDVGTDVKFVPKSAARYVVELPAGTVDGKAIAIGRAALFDIKKEDIQ